MADQHLVWRRALTCEVAWAAHPEHPRALAAVPLTSGGLPCVALPYALAAQLEPLRRTGQAAFAVTEENASGRGVALFGAIEVTDDVTGERFQTDLLAEELVKYPPSRVYADSSLLRRENWWWLPRIIVRMRRIDEAVALPPRSDQARDAVLVRHDTGSLRLDVVAPTDGTDWPQQRVRLSAGRGPLRGDTARSVAFGHQYTAPDLDRWETWGVQGILRGDELTVEHHDGVPQATLEPFGLVQRFVRQRNLERACRRGIADAERAT